MAPFLTQKQPHQVSIRPGISLVFKGDLLGSLWFHHGFPAFKVFLVFFELLILWNVQRLFRCDCMPTNYPVEHLALAPTGGMGWCQTRPITWHPHESLNLYKKQPLLTGQSRVSGCWEKWCLCSRVQSKKRHFLLIVQRRKLWKESGKVCLLRLLR